MEYWSKEMFSFVFLVLTMCGGGVMAILGGVGCFEAPILDDDDTADDDDVEEMQLLLDSLLDLETN
jgi:hypothetical protein